MDLREVGYDDRDWINLAQDRDRWRAYPLSEEVIWISLQGTVVVLTRFQLSRRLTERLEEVTLGYHLTQRRRAEATMQVTTMAARLTQAPGISQEAMELTTNRTARTFTKPPMRLTTRPFNGIKGDRNLMPTTPSHSSDKAMKSWSSTSNTFMPKSYQFGYAVKDYATGNDYHRHETSDGNTIQGEYRVQLPDGRTQIVSYTADWKNGYRAQVRYEGEAQYPTNYGAPSPAHTGASFGGSSYSGHGGSNPGYGGYDAGHGYSGSPSGVSSSYGPPGYGK
ncbi:hypothetical protein ANN_11644 [Periplaneta americana]|uniref:Pro-resilin n=1 Tax=Periplaneta americana TaxID=6978 RepID=A0ABQ8T6Q3_PERAM|nr:hypothetical protein ANN_11644 [Periplaneta americana]